MDKKSKKQFVHCPMHLTRANTRNTGICVPTNHSPNNHEHADMPHNLNSSNQAVVHSQSQIVMRQIRPSFKANNTVGMGGHDLRTNVTRQRRRRTVLGCGARHGFLLLEQLILCAFYQQLSWLVPQIPTKLFFDELAPSKFWMPLEQNKPSDQRPTGRIEVSIELVSMTTILILGSEKFVPSQPVDQSFICVKIRSITSGAKSFASPDSIHAKCALQGGVNTNSFDSYNHSVS